MTNKPSKPMVYAALQQASYAAFMKAIAATGDAYKGMSWFGRNKR